MHVMFVQVLMGMCIPPFSDKCVHTISDYNLHSSGFQVLIGVMLDKNDVQSCTCTFVIGVIMSLIFTYVFICKQQPVVLARWDDNCSA